jgi:hypothetical protein
MEHFTTLLAYDNNGLVLVGNDMRFTIPWVNVLMLSIVQERFHICLVDGRTGYRVGEEDYHRIEAAYATKLAGNKLKDFSAKDTLQCPEI